MAGRELDGAEAIQAGAGGDRERRGQRGHALGEFAGADVARGRAHAHLSGDGGLIKLDGERDIDRIGRLLEEALGLLIHALDLAFFHAEDAERLAQIIQVSSARRQDDDLAARGERALEFGWIARGEDYGDCVDGLIPDGQALPYIGHDGADARVALGQVFRGVRGNVEADAAGFRDGVQSMGQVVAGAGATSRREAGLDSAKGAESSASWTAPVTASTKGAKWPMAR